MFVVKGGFDFAWGNIKVEQWLPHFPLIRKTNPGFSL